MKILLQVLFSIPFFFFFFFEREEIFFFLKKDHRLSMCWYLIMRIWSSWVRFSCYYIAGGNVRVIRTVLLVFHSPLVYPRTLIHAHGMPVVASGIRSLLISLFRNSPTHHSTHSVTYLSFIKLCML